MTLTWSMWLNSTTIIDENQIIQSYSHLEIYHIKSLHRTVKEITTHTSHVQFDEWLQVPSNMVFPSLTLHQRLVPAHLEAKSIKFMTNTRKETWAYRSLVLFNTCNSTTCLDAPKYSNLIQHCPQEYFPHATQKTCYHSLSHL